MELVGKSETVVPIYQITQCQIAEATISNSTPGKLVTLWVCKNVSQHVGIGTQFFNTFRIFSIHAIRT